MLPGDQSFGFTDSQEDKFPANPMFVGKRYE